jgi:hypothetical protein
MEPDALPTPPNTYVRAIYDFKAEPDSPGEMSLRVGDIIKVHMRTERGWWNGTQELDSRSGWFPGAYCVYSVNSSREGGKL